LLRRFKTNKELDNKWQRGFYTIAAGQAVSYIGSSAVQFALIWWLTYETGSALMLSLAGLLIYLPQILLGPFAGVWVDRLKRKPVIILSDMFTGIVAMVFSAAFFLGTPPYWMACVILGVRAIGGVFHLPALQAAISLLVPKDQLIRANSVNQFIQTGSFIFGPVIGAALYAALPMRYILITDFIGALVACLTVLAVKIPEVKQEIKIVSHFFKDMKEGAMVFLDDKRLSVVTIFLLICGVFLLPLDSLYPLLIFKGFNGTEWHIGAIQAVYSTGTIAGAVLVGAIGKRIKDKLKVTMLGLLLRGITSLVCGALPSNTLGFSLLFLNSFIMGASYNILTIPYTTYMQTTIAQEKQGRAFSVFYSALCLTVPIGLMIAGPIAEALGVRVLFIFSGALGIFTMLIGIISKDNINNHQLGQENV
jgi:DHA3 family macrolide efflux protein-like MFS transporter